jgi:hypothetical protein
MTQHTEDIHNVVEGDHVTITTTEGETFDAECERIDVENADRRTGEIRETTTWFFTAVEHEPIVSIIYGLRSRPSDPEFPVHKEAWDRQQEGDMGYIENITRPPTPES